MLALLLTPLAEAACAVEQRTRADGVDIGVRALAEPVACRTVSLAASTPLTVRAWVWSPEERRSRLDADHLRALPGGGWEVHAPELEAGGRLELAVDMTGDDLELRLAPAADVPLVGVHVDETRSFVLEYPHPGWGFADASRARTRVEQILRLGADAPAQRLALPVGARDIEAGGLSLGVGALLLPAGAGEYHVAWTLAGAAPQGREALAPGSLTLRTNGASFAVTLGPGVTATALPDGVRFDAPEGGEARWRVRSVEADAVIPDVATWVAGLDWRFARASLPEPAVPTELRGRRDADALRDELLALVRALRDGQLAETDPQHPRPLNRAWRSGWATPVERGLVLHRFLGQERFTAGWVLTGAEADAGTLTGFDHLLVTVRGPNGTEWIDPSCRVCTPGEIGTRWSGRPAVGLDVAAGTTSAAGRARRGAPAALPALPEGATVPRATGRLERRLELAGERFHAHFNATGAAALWLREQLVDVEPTLRGLRLGAALGLTDATVRAATGFEEAGAPITLELESTKPPGDPFPTPTATPWDGGWGDAE